MKKEIIDEILKNHKVIRDIENGINRPIVYDIGDDIEVYIKQSYDKITLWIFDNKIDSFLSLEDSRFKVLFLGLKDVAKEIIKEGLIFNIKLDFNLVKKENNKEINMVKNNKKKVIGYCRNGGYKYLRENKIDIQEEKILEIYGDIKIYREEFTGTTLDRPILKEVVKELNDGDILVITKLDRLVLNVKDGITLLDKLFNKNIIVHVLNIGILENSRLGRFFIQTMLATVEMESTLLREKIQAGKENARKNPDFKEGRPKVFADEQISRALAMLLVNGGKYSYDKVAEITNISKSTLIRENKKRS